MNASDATLTGLATAPTGGTVAGTARYADWNPGVNLVIAADAGSGRGHAASAALVSTARAQP